MSEGEDQAGLPEYIRRGGGFNIGGALALMPDIGAEQLETTINELTSPASMLSKFDPGGEGTVAADRQPQLLLRPAVLENDFEEVPAEMGPIGGLAEMLGIGETLPDGRQVMERKHIEAAQDLIPLLSRINRLGGTTSDREDTTTQAWLNFLGAPVKQLTPGVMEREQKRRQGAAKRSESADQARQRALDAPTRRIPASSTASRSIQGTNRKDSHGNQEVIGRRLRRHRTARCQKPRSRSAAAASDEAVDGGRHRVVPAARHGPARWWQRPARRATAARHRRHQEVSYDYGPPTTVGTGPKRTRASRRTTPKPSSSTTRATPRTPRRRTRHTITEPGGSPSDEMVEAARPVHLIAGTRTPQRLGADATVTVTGTNLRDNSVVEVDQVGVPTSYVSDTELTATLTDPGAAGTVT